MDNKKNGVIRLVVSLALLVFFTYTAIWGIGYGASGSIKTIKQGLDLAGGVSITYESVKENPTSQELEDTIERLRVKAETYSNEAEVYAEGSNRITIDIPGESDANEILEELGKLGQLYFVDSDGTVWLTGDDIEDAQPATYTNSTTGAREYVVSLTLSSEGASKFAEATEANIGSYIYIYYDDQLISYPTVSEKITSTTCQISNMSSWEAADTLATNIRNGALPLELTEVRSTVVGASLGTDAIKTSLIAAAIGLALVMLFLILYYRIPGVAASLALIIYTGMMIMLLSAFQITLTLSGIAGIILSIGMAVDANVIIYARIKEEIGKGKTVASAIKLGYSKALSAIVDGNITTLIAAAVLYFLCSGTIRGFATTLALGIVLSMFTALVISRMILVGFYAVGIRDAKFYGRTVEKEAFDFIGKKNICFVVSLVLIVAGIGTAAYHMVVGDAFNYSIEFSGGTSTNITMPESMTIEEIEDQVVPVVKEATGVSAVRATTVSDSTEIIIKTTSLELEAREALTEALVEAFGVSEDDIKMENIKGSVGKEMRTSAIWAVIVATICILIYIWFRFRDIRFGAGAVAALVHDVLIVVGCYAVFRWSVGNTFIACVLTIVGYSINATIVIFDRIRENMAEKKDKDSLAEVVNRAITQSLSRSINTSLTTLIMVVMLYIIGVSAIREFALPLMIGIVCGGYSSLFLAGAIWYVLKSRSLKKAKA